MLFLCPEFAIASRVSNATFLRSSLPSVEPSRNTERRLPPSECSGKDRGMQRCRIILRSAASRFMTIVSGPGATSCHPLPGTRGRTRKNHIVSAIFPVPATRLRRREVCVLTVIGTTRKTADPRIRRAMRAIRSSYVLYVPILMLYRESSAGMLFFPFCASHGHGVRADRVLPSRRGSVTVAGR